MCGEFMFFYIISGVMVPFIGTVIGSAAVFFIKNSRKNYIEKYLSAFAGGIMFAAAIWSLILPSLEMGDSEIRTLAETVAGFIAGFVFMIFTDELTEKINCEALMGKNSALQFLAVTVHNIPEGLAVGMVYSALIYEKGNSDWLSAFVLSLGIAIQNIPEGAIISLPLYSKKIKKVKAFAYGTFSGVVEPVAALISVAVYGLIGILLPFLLSFAAGAMIFVVIKQLVPEMYTSDNKHNNGFTLIFASGFVVMMGLDVLLG